MYKDILDCLSPYFIPVYNYTTHAVHVLLAIFHISPSYNIPFVVSFFFFYLFGAMSIYSLLKTLYAPKCTNSFSYLYHL